MKAVICKQARLEVGEWPEPVPGPQQLVLEVLRCGICGSDLHARHHCDALADLTLETGYAGIMRSHEAIVLGHEFCGEVVERGSAVRGGPRVGTRVVAMPLLREGDAVHTTGLSAAAPGAYAEHMLVEAALAMEVPNGLSADHAALTEPMAVALHAVRRGEVGKRQPAVVIGCGPIGLAVIAMLKAHDVRTVIASDPSPARRRLALRCGADEVVDPGERSPFASAADHGLLTETSALMELAVSSMETLRRVPLLPWWRVFRAADAFGAAMPKHPVVFECVGVPGMLDQLIVDAPLYSRVVVVGVCMEPDRIRPGMAINKELELRFVIGYTPLDFRDALHLLAEGRVDPGPLITGVVGLEGVEGAFEALGSPEQHAKILIDPKSDAREPVAPR